MDDRTGVVVGGGIGGPATALALCQRGWRVHVLERAPTFTDISAGLSLWPNAIRALDVLGLADEIRRKAASESGGGVRDRRGRWLTRADNDQIARRFGWPMPLVRRADLVQILAGAAPVEALCADRRISGGGSPAGRSRSHCCSKRSTTTRCCATTCASCRHGRRTREALVGDAAHAMDPFLGQGACPALEDAVTLAACR